MDSFSQEKYVYCYRSLSADNRIFVLRKCVKGRGDIQPISNECVGQ